MKVYNNGQEDACRRLAFRDILVPMNIGIVLRTLYIYIYKVKNRVFLCKPHGENGETTL